MGGLNVFLEVVRFFVFFKDVPKTSIFSWQGFTKLHTSKRTKLQIKNIAQLYNIYYFYIYKIYIFEEGRFIRDKSAKLN